MDEVLLAKCSCSACGNHIEFPIEAADAKVDCPHCSTQTQLTLQAPTDEPARPAAVNLLAGFEGLVPRTPTSILYHVGLLFVTVVMLLLPVLYVALIGTAIWGVSLYAWHFVFLIASMDGGARLFLVKLMAYLGPLFIGVVIVFFMIKPIFARRPARAQPLCLNPAAEPTLYAFIAKICDLVGAPMPKRIYLDCQLNASAGFRRGIISLFGNDLVLTVGVPLVATLSLREFAGVIAHEFGHFTQGAGMRLSYIVRSINGWFARVVYARDAWDVALEEWGTGTDDWRVMIVVNLARLGVFFSRMILMALMFAGHGVSCFLLRQMEYDADSYEIKLAGSETFESTAKRLAVLDTAAGAAYKEMRAKWNLSCSLPENFPAFMVRQHARIAPALKEQIEDSVGLKRTGLFSTHPSDGDRIRKARRASEPGIFHIDMPASVLFSHFEGACRQITLQHYAEDLGIPLASAELQPVHA